MSTDTDLPRSPLDADRPSRLDAPEAAWSRYAAAAGLAVALGARCVAGRDRLPGAGRRPTAARRSTGCSSSVARRHRGRQPRGLRSTPGRRCWSPTTWACGSAWAAPGRGCPGAASHEVEHRPRRGWRRDGLLVVRPHYVQRVLEDLDPRARRTARLNRRLHRAPLAVPLGLAHPRARRRARPDHRAGRAGRRAHARWWSDLAMPPGVEPRPRRCRGDTVTVAAVLAGPRRRARRAPPRGACATRARPIALLIGDVAARFDRPGERDERARARGRARPPPRSSPARPPSPLRDDGRRGPRRGAPRARAELRPVEDETQVWGDPRSEPETEVDRSSSTTYAALEPAADPVIGPAARGRPRPPRAHASTSSPSAPGSGPHVIEAIEVDDFAPCGGDFYARGHLRTLARVLGVDVAPLLETYDERYADAPIDPRRVFEAELATGGRLDPRHPRRPELVGARRGRDGADPAAGRSPGS